MSSSAEDTVNSLIASHENTLSQVSVKAVGSQVALMSGISVSLTRSCSAPASPHQLFGGLFKESSEEGENPCGRPKDTS